jgi:hypothetical protein
VDKLPFKSDYVGTYIASLTPPEIIGPLPEGIRINFYVTGGEMFGEKLRGSLRAVGGDWLTLRSDGVATLDVRVTIETHDGALIYVHYNGVGDLGPAGYADFLAGKLPKTMGLRTTPRMHTAHAAYTWVNRVQFFSIGEVDFENSSVRYDVYALG